QDVELAGAQLRERRRDGGGAQLSKLGHALRDSVVEDDIAGYHRLENPFDVGRVGTFDDVSTGTISYRRDGRVVVLGHGEYDDFHVGVFRRQPSVHFEPGPTRQVQVQQREIGGCSLNQIENLRRRGGLTDQFYLLHFGERRGQSQPEYGVIVDHNDLDHQVTASGSVACTRVPCGITDAITVAPPSSAARSHIAVERKSGVA